MKQFFKKFSRQMCIKLVSLAGRGFHAPQKYIYMQKKILTENPRALACNPKTSFKLRLLERKSLKC